MSPRRLAALAIMIPTLAAAQGPGPLKYPDARRADTVETLHGRAVPDPYRWLEDPNSDETKAWVTAENRVTFGYLEQMPTRAKIKERLTRLWNYERFGTPSREGAWYIFAKNDGLQNQSVIYKTRALDAPAEILIDPNSLSNDGTVALGSLSFSDDGKHLAYSLSASGSDWLEWRVRDVATGARSARRAQVGQVQRGGLAQGRLGLLLQPLRRAERGRDLHRREQVPEGVLPQAGHRRRTPTRSSTNARTSPTGA